MQNSPALRLVQAHLSEHRPCGLTWVDDPRPDPTRTPADERFTVFARMADGGELAVWHRPGTIGEDGPVVLFDTDGRPSVLADDVAQALALVALAGPAAPGVRVDDEPDHGCPDCLDPDHGPAPAPDHRFLTWVQQQLGATPPRDVPTAVLFATLRHPGLPRTARRVRVDV